MNWKLKSNIQNIVSFLPSSISYPAYYWIQRRFGQLRPSKINPISHLIAGIETCKKIETLGFSPIGGIFLEIGTGRRVNTPLAFWLLGAQKVITVDLNPYLKFELVKEDINYIRANQSSIEKLFAGSIVNNRLKSLIEFTNYEYSIADILKFCGIEYIAPADATNLPLPSQCIDFYTSYTVLEHIPPNILTEIFKEGNRVIKNGGSFIHRIDYSDHFSHSDKSISSINFLQFTDSEWDKIAGNRYMYMNRLRHDDFLALFNEANHNILLQEPNTDKKIPDLMNSQGLQLDQRFLSKPQSVLATTGSWFVSQYNGLI
jgi:SAM-dependent methyltransferase